MPSINFIPITCDICGLREDLEEVSVTESPTDGGWLSQPYPGMSMCPECRLRGLWTGDYRDRRPAPKCLGKPPVIHTHPQVKVPWYVNVLAGFIGLGVFFILMVIGLVML